MKNGWQRTIGKILKRLHIQFDQNSKWRILNSSCCCLSLSHKITEKTLWRHMKTTTNGIFRPIIFHGSSVYAFDLDQSKPVVSIARLSILSCQVFTWIWKCKQKQNKPAIQLAIWQTKPCQAKIKIAENCVKCEFNFI